MIDRLGRQRVRRDCRQAVSPRVVRCDGDNSKRDRRHNEEIAEGRASELKPFLPNWQGTRFPSKRRTISNLKISPTADFGLDLLPGVSGRFHGFLDRVL